MLDKLLGWLSPTSRKAIYSAVGSLAAILVILGYTNEAQVATWLGVLTAVLGVAFQILAAIKAKRVDFTVFYGAGAALVTALLAAGWLNDETASNADKIMTQLAVAIPLLIAAFRTNTTVPTGEPEAEWVAKHAAPAVNPPV